MLCQPHLPFILCVFLTIITGTNAFSIITTLTPRNPGVNSNFHGSTGGFQYFAQSKENIEFDIEIITQDPKCIVVKNILSHEECEEYISRANYEIENLSLDDADDDDDDDENDTNTMIRSNAPDVSLNLSRLWPLPFLCLGAGIPPVIKLLFSSDESTKIDLNQMVEAALPNISIAFIVSILSIIAITQGMRQYAEKFTRTSKSIALNQEKDFELISALVDRASTITKHDWTQWEAPVITKYSTGDVFASHNDASPTKGSEWADLGGQRVVTVITYLNTCEQGGGTKFDRLNFTMQPQQGSALIFYPADVATLEADERTIHQSLPAVDDKYIVQLFGRHKRVPPPLGIPDSYIHHE